MYFINKLKFLKMLKYYIYFIFHFFKVNQFFISLELEFNFAVKFLKKFTFC